MLSLYCDGKRKLSVYGVTDHSELEFPIFHQKNYDVVVYGMSVSEKDLCYGEWKKEEAIPFNKKISIDGHFLRYPSIILSSHVSQYDVFNKLSNLISSSLLSKYYILIPVEAYHINLGEICKEQDVSLREALLETQKKLQADSISNGNFIKYKAKIVDFYINRVSIGFTVSLPSNFTEIRESLKTTLPIKNIMIHHLTLGYAYKNLDCVDLLNVTLYNVTKTFQGLEFEVTSPLVCKLNTMKNINIYA